MIKDNEKVGELLVSDITISLQRSIQTNLIAHIPVILFHINLTDQKSALFNDQVLQSAVVSRSFFNSHTEKRMTLLHKNKYTNGKNQIESLIKTTEISFSMTMLYTTEPNGIRSIYSEFHQCYVKVIKTGLHTYCITTPEGQIGYYYYEKGICVKIETITSRATIDTILVKRTTALK